MAFPIHKVPFKPQSDPKILNKMSISSLIGVYCLIPIILRITQHVTLIEPRTLFMGCGFIMLHFIISHAS